MSVNLVKGQKIDLTKGNPGLQKVKIGCGWDINKYDKNETFDIDASAFLLAENDKVLNDQGFVFYHNSSDPSNSVVYSGDNRTGEGEGDDETIIVDLSKVPNEVKKIVFVVSIYDANNKAQNFGLISNSYIRAIDEDTNAELFKYELDEDFSTETGLIAGELYRRNNDWKFSAVGKAMSGGLSTIAKMYGVDIQ